MGFRAFDSRSSIRMFRPDLHFSVTQFKVEPLAQKHVAPFEGLLAGLGVITEQEQALYDTQVECKAVVVTCDRVLNRQASRVHKEVLIITNDSTKHNLYKHYFGTKSLKEFVRPTLKSQLAAMLGWVKSLKESEHAALSALAADVEAATKAAVVAVEKKTAIDLEIKVFRETGDRKKFIDACNAARSLAYGELAKLAHENDSLPSNFADSFFLHYITEEEEVTVESVQEKIDELTEELEEQKELLVQLKEEQEAKAKAEAEELAQRAALAELEKIKADAEKKAAAIRAKLRK